jgi:hypothetical protein
MRACVCGQLKLRRIKFGTVLHAINKPNELAQTVLGFPCGHVRIDLVGDIEDSPITIHLTISDLSSRFTS